MAQQDVSHSVLSIIAAYTSCRDVLRKIKTRLGNRKVSKQPLPPPSAAGLRLNRSLRRGPIDIEESYRNGVRSLGPTFTAGDDSARTELNTVLLKLNAGLVDIISSFIKTPNPTKVQLDYEALTSLSDASRAQANLSLRQLVQRLCSRLPRAAPAGKAKTRGTSDSKKPIEPVKDKLPRHRRHKSIPEGEYYTISKQDNETQVALVRPAQRAKRALSTESAQEHGRHPSQSTKGLTKRSAKKATEVSGANDSHLTQVGLKTHQTTLPNRDTARRAPATMEAIYPHDTPTSAPPHVPEHVFGPPAKTAHATYAIPRRRPIVNTETMYTMATESTKLGEIPMHRWPQPFDFAEAARLNALAQTTNWVDGQDRSGRKKPGLIKRLFRRRQAQVIA